MASESSIQKWNKVLDDVERMNNTPSMRLTRRASAEGAAAAAAPNMFSVVVGALTSPFASVWLAGRPEEPELLAILQPVADAIRSFDRKSDLIPQIDHFLEVVAEAKGQLNIEAMTPHTADEIISDMERALKITLLVAGTSHVGPMSLIDQEIGERARAISRGEDRAAKYFDFATSKLTDAPSAKTISLADFAAIVDLGPATSWDEVLQPDPADQPPLMKQFAAQAVVEFFTEWEEYYRPALAAALGCSEDDIRIDYFGDLRNMRHDYVHNRGICRNSARNKVLKWFTKGEVMIPTPANYLELLTAFPAEQLRIKPPPFVKERKRVEANATAGLVDEFEKIADTNGLSKDAALDQALTEWLAAHPPPA
ncbi:hypothetical protein QGN32_15165 [Mycolicibacterium sp. ND9-15]|uniref:hypothetical protein n=1 Tax=Mycolicibacterium sp. ND9-15 TaxID=3042320 RepID=UPI002DDB695D|nr:hypothetical protein [Mycolicibacterium sp. ND9-15]WSE54830.1 hypothetical protein QGN32_15165 [Mycolicibacterium sp. ND9-15]